MIKSKKWIALKLLSLFLFQISGHISTDVSVILYFVFYTVNSKTHFSVSRHILVSYEMHDAHNILYVHFKTCFIFAANICRQIISVKVECRLALRETRVHSTAEVRRWGNGMNPLRHGPWVHSARWGRYFFLFICNSFRHLVPSRQMKYLPQRNTSAMNWTLIYLSGKMHRTLPRLFRNPTGYIRQ